MCDANAWSWVGFSNVAVPACVPCRDLLSCQVRQGRASCMTQETLCTTLAGNDCPVVTITAPEDEGSPLHERKGAFFTGVVPPRSCCAALGMGPGCQPTPACTRLPVLSSLKLFSSPHVNMVFT